MKNSNFTDVVCMVALVGLALVVTALGVNTANDTTHSGSDVNDDIEDFKKQLRKEYKRASKQNVSRSYYRTLMAGVHASNKEYIESEVHEYYHDELLDYNDSLYDEYVD